MSYLLALTLLLSPAYVIKFNLFGFPTNLLMVWVVLIWLIFAIWIVAKKQILLFWNSIIQLDKKLLMLVGLLFLSGLVSLFIRGFDRAKLGQFIVLFLQPISIFFIGRYIINKFSRSAYCLLLTAYFLLAIMGIYAIIQYFTLAGLPPAWWGNSVEPKRALAFFAHPNFYALFTAPLLAFLIPDAFLSVKSKIFNFKSITWIIGAFGLFLSLSRAGWLGLAVAMLAYLIFAANKKARLTIVISAAVIFITILSIPNFRYRVLLPFYGEKSSASRLSLWQTGWKGIKESPITGLGLTGFSRQWATLNTDPGLTDTHNFPHNVLLDFWVETGIIGLISFIGIAGLYIYRGLRYRVIPAKAGILTPNEKIPNQVGNDTIKLSITLFLIALIFQGLIDNPYFKNDLAIVFWVILSLSSISSSPLMGEAGRG